ncbi:MAG: bifunctional YncE family protein/alkaline phosphatase family protein [Bacteroidetes bacterium]|nr:bifunctional YncE family protein/alkaline phosphatase family protein [Bacteroidota bacterium]
MKNCFFYFLLFFSLQTFAQPASETNPIKKRITLPNGWSLTPVGKSLQLGDLPLNIAVSASNKYMAVTNNGQSTQSIQLIDVKNEKRLDSINIPKSWLGLKFSADEKYLYASGGNDNWILKYAIVANKLVLKDSIKLGEKWPEKISPAGLDIDDAKQLLYVVTKENNSLYIVDLVSKKVLNKFELGGEGYTCLLSKNKKELYITCWGCDKLKIFDTENRKFTDEIAVGDNPNDIVLSKNNRYLFVANANDNDVSVIDLESKKVIETLHAALYPDAPMGSTTNALALNRSENTLYVANADNNCLAVFDVSKPGHSKSKGFIPVGWYPTAIKVIGNKVFVANGKGFTSMANPNGPNPTTKKMKVKYQDGDEEKAKGVQYIGGLFKGTLSIFTEPDEKSLSKYSKLVYENTPYTKSKELETDGEPGNPIPMKVGDPSPIKYVFYIIKENRTYDQVLGDMKEGNGDPSLVLFGEHITPNQHALAREFVLLDNFYCDAEVSADGHNWSMGAYANDYLEKTWPTSYGGRGGKYDAEGNREIANNKNGFIWENCKRAEVSFRTYGEFADDYKPNIPILKDHFCPYYTSWDQTVRDTTRVSQWKRDFDSLLSINALPQLSTLRIINDHTEGLAKGRPTPFVHVADNDLAVGQFVEYLSKSKIWQQSVVFILEDDAQNGPDHVDAHRTTAYVAGGYVKRHYVDHTIYSTTSMVRTIELILGMPPMSQYDAAAEPMWRCFTATPNLDPFISLPCNIDLTERNTAWNELAEKSARFDFTKEDRVPDLLFNEVLWKAIKGLNSEVPAPKRAAFVKTKEND